MGNRHLRNNLTFARKISSGTKRQNMRRFSISKIALFIVILLVFAIDNNLGLWRSNTRVIINDVCAYYAYLPALFIYNDAELKTLHDGKIGDQFILWPKVTPEGKNVITSSSGMAILYFPFFIAAHVAAGVFDVPATGYSLPYRYGLMLSSLFYLAVGLFFLRKLLIKYFDEWVTAIVIVVIPLTTNMLWYTVVESPMSHVYSFSLISVFLFLTDRWFEKITISKTLVLGLLTGLIVLVRPTNILVLLLFIFWNIKNSAEMKVRFQLFLKYWKLIVLMIAAFILVWIPQMLYWKMQTGHFFYYSYPDDQGFFFENPQIIGTLFSWRKGWLLYTPVMIFALIGIWFLWKNYRGFFLPVTIFTVFAVYVTSSWWDWWYGGSFGLRAYIDFYGIFAIPMAAFLSWILRQRKFARILLLFIFMLVALQSAFHHVQYHYRAIHWMAMTKEAYLDSFWRIRPSEKFDDLIREPDYQAARKGIYRYSEKPKAE
jgi:hypothetical protein